MVSALNNQHAGPAAMMALASLAEYRPKDVAEHDGVIINMMMNDSRLDIQGGQVLVQLSNISKVGTYFLNDLNTTLGSTLDRLRQTSRLIEVKTWPSWVLTPSPVLGSMFLALILLSFKSICSKPCYNLEEEKNGVKILVCLYFSLFVKI